MTVIPWAADRQIEVGAKQPLGADELRRLREKYELADRWLLSFSGSSGRKNARGLLAALSRLAPGLRGTLQVVLIGCEAAGHRQELEAEAQQLGVATSCRVLGFVPHADLPGLLRGSCGLLIPSRYEGFGLPILDAFACGIPVLTAEVSSMPEVAGDAALYCDPDDALSIAAGIVRLLDRETAARLVERGREQLKQFSWQHTAEAMCRVYEHACRGAYVARPETSGGLQAARRTLRGVAAQQAEQPEVHAR
jgi:alpha-1,3-rhamnosyl/mannosyltransferase